MKRTLYLVRHAKSSWDDASLADIDRPLNGRGRRASPEMGRRMAAQGHRPELIISSPANRARTTARNIARELGIDENTINIDEDIYFAGTGGMLNALARADDDVQSVMLVGHNPSMTDLLNRLSGSRVYNMPTCAIAIIGFDTNCWADVRNAEGELLGYDYPKGSGHFRS